VQRERELQNSHPPPIHFAVAVHAARHYSNDKRKDFSLAMPCRTIVECKPHLAPPCNKKLEMAWASRKSDNNEEISMNFSAPHSTAVIYAS
jgi:hypothetical protein